ncbi:MAG: phosphatase PAP2 family protein [Prevotella sp.]
MKKKIGITCMLAIGAIASAFAYTTQKNKWKLETPEMAPVLTMEEYTASTPALEMTAVASTTSALPALAVAKDIKPYTFWDDQTYVGIPLFIAGIIAKSEKESFRQDYTNKKSTNRLIKYNFHSEIDNYTQFVPMFLSTGLNLAGVEGRSSFGRYLASGAMSYAIMAAIVNPIKYSAKEMRPDGSTRNSWPSGHTATAFVSATILHKEYGLTRSPWYSIFGYGVATATGVMRVLNNRHWVSDVLSGAGIGIFSTEVAYGLADLMFKEKGLKRNDLSGGENIITNPSFFSVSMGVGLGSKNLDFGNGATGEDDLNRHFDLKTSTVVGAEGAYFFNKYVGVGGRLRVRSTPVKGLNVISDEDQSLYNELLSIAPELAPWIATREMKVETDHITEFTSDLGVYFNIPLSHRFALGTKLLVGRSVIQDLDINAHFAGNVMDMKYKVEGDQDGVKVTDGKRILTDTPYDVEWDYLTLSGSNSTKFGTGISLTYAYKQSFSWRLFVDYDVTRKNFELTYDPFGYLDKGAPKYKKYLELDEPGVTEPERRSIDKTLHNFVVGGAFCVSF